MNTTENNKLIAEFMGAPFVGDYKGSKGGYQDTYLYDFRKLNIGNEVFISDVQMKFHTDWNWLMPVIQKINETGYAGGITYELKESLMAVDIGNTYKEVVEFIKWYNEGKTKKQ